MKTGSTGVLCFVSVEHTVTTPRGIAIRERQDIVYRDMGGAAPAATAKAPPPPPVAKHRETHVSDPVLLFRYSALTFNGHRIHYDRDYVGMPPQKFSYRGVQPLFEGTEFSINANDTHAGTELWIANAEGQPTMKGTATW